MSSEKVIKVNKLSKYYEVYAQRHARLLQMLTLSQKKYYQEFWALKDLSFEIEKGETIGIIGCNGSGKSTLLQLICGTLHPSEGTIETKGRIAALLELGSGFNPEFTGRENIFMNATILGLSKKEIESRYDAIVNFADIGDFIEQPVKTYSSGMVVRLAFAVMAHVDADILVIDEALAVGDAVFTLKCMRFIQSYQKRGTLLFVSHDMGSITKLCKRVIWLDKGRLVKEGLAKNIAEEYLQHTLQAVYGDEVVLASVRNDKEVPALLTKPVLSEDTSTIDYHSQLEATPNLESASGFKTGIAELNAIEIHNLSQPGQSIFKGWEWVAVVIKATAVQALAQPILGFTLNDKSGQTLFGENTLSFTQKNPIQIAAGQSFYARFKFRLPMLQNGEYVMFASVANGELYDHIQHHLLHNAMIIKVSSSTVRWGLVGVPFDEVFMERN